MSFNFISYHLMSCSPTPTYKQPLYGCQPDEPQASLATTDRRRINVYIVLLFVLLFMYAVLHCLYSVGNKIASTTTTTSSSKGDPGEWKIWIGLDVNYLLSFDNPMLIHRVCEYRQVPLHCHCHDDVIKWKHFPRYWPFVRGIHRVPLNSPHKDQWRGVLCFLWSAPWINGWVNNGEAGALRRHHAHCDVIVMFSILETQSGST